MFRTVNSLNFLYVAVNYGASNAGASNTCISSGLKIGNVKSNEGSNCFNGGAVLFDGCCISKCIANCDSCSIVTLVTVNHEFVAFSVYYVESNVLVLFIISFGNPGNGTDDHVTIGGGCFVFKSFASSESSLNERGSCRSNFNGEFYGFACRTTGNGCD